MRLRLNQNACTSLDQSGMLEWLETNGIGGFASSSVSTINTRRYHGLLTAATKPPVGRMLLLAKLEETLVIGGVRHELSANRYGSVVHPRGYELMTEFRLDPFPVWTWRAGSTTIVRSLSMVQGENTLVIRYQVDAAGADWSLEVKPLVAFRDYHATTHANTAINGAIREDGQVVSIEPYIGLPRLYFAHDAGRVIPGGDWYYGFEYAIERERGLDYNEDLFHPFTLVFPGEKAEPSIVVSTSRTGKSDAAELQRLEVLRRSAIAAASPADDQLVGALTEAADQFLVSPAGRHSVIAGYHWFSDWGRDTMIALPGLTLVTGRFEIARRILQAFTEHISEGMLPNRFPDAGEAPEYNTVDATLWYFEAIRSYVARTGDSAWVREHLWDAMRDILSWHRRGTRYGIRMDEDGLLLAGAPGIQLTWMDAKIGDWVVTPRHGKPVEIQALWYNALRVMESLAASFGEEDTRQSAAATAELAKATFNREFWNHEAGCLFDCIDGEQRDGSIRPNQIFAASLHHAILNPEYAGPMLEVVRGELLTPMGLRTLAPHDPRYRGVCDGGVAERDSAYHQGTVWPWLLGAFISAWVRYHGEPETARQQARLWLEGIAGHLQAAGLGQISEIADGDVPHTPRGCIAQAWSVAELLRAAVDDVLIRN